mmetsp:Transcript_51390/g.104569  ORF Transcript_51390/g.104569 Transcript_51390/m.104569 type:complete len:453 (-) Transcript_51390:33-1391(-)
MKGLLMDECERRGVSAKQMPKPLREAKVWAANSIAARGQRLRCRLCSTPSTACLLCSTCDHSYCRQCLGVDKGALWSLGFQCPECVVEDARLHVSADSSRSTTPDPALTDLARSMLQTMAASLKPGTWALYQRCINDMLEFAKEYELQIFPVDSPSAVNGLSLFFEQLRRLGFSWARISHYRAAIRKLCEMSNLDDPFETYPRLKVLCEGLKKRITLRPRRKEGATLPMIITLLNFWRRSEVAYRAAGKHRLADTVLRHQVAVILGWFGMRRSSDIHISRDGTMGLRRDHVSYVRGSHVTLFIQLMKNDPYGGGNEVMLAWETASGVPIGETFLRYEQRLQECNIPAQAPFVLPTKTGTSGGFRLPASGSGFKPTGCLKSGLKECFTEFGSDPALLSRFTWHSLRRGGASHSFRDHLDARLIMGHGLWKSEEGVRPYMAASLEGKLKVTRTM